MEALENIQVVIAIVATLIATAIGIANFQRNRSKLRVDFLTSVSKDTNDIKITVTNVGAKDVTVVAIGFAVFESEESVLPWSKRRRRKVARRYSKLGTELLDDGTTHDEIILLKPTETKAVSIPSDFVAGWVEGGEAAWPYAEDSVSRDVYAERPAHVNRDA